MGRLILYLVEGFVSAVILGMVVFYLYKFGRFIINSFLKGIKK